jgi:hypothetical protein
VRRYVFARFTDGNVVVVGPAGWAPRPGEKVALRAVDTGADVDLEVRREAGPEVIRYTWPRKPSARAGELARAHYWRRAGTWAWQVAAARKLDGLLAGRSHRSIRPEASSPGANDSV